MSGQSVAKTEEWPLGPNWGLAVTSERGKGQFKNFDFIKITALGPNGYSRPITSIMVPKIDGIVCESHSFLANLIHQNIAAIKQERDAYRAALESICGNRCARGLNPCEAREILEKYEGKP